MAGTFSRAMKDISVRVNTNGGRSVGNAAMDREDRGGGRRYNSDNRNEGILLNIAILPIYIYLCFSVIYVCSYWVMIGRVKQGEIRCQSEYKRDTNKYNLQTEFKCQLPIDLFLWMLFVYIRPARLLQSAEAKDTHV